MVSRTGAFFNKSPCTLRSLITKSQEKGAQGGQEQATNLYSTVFRESQEQYDY